MRQAGGQLPAFCFVDIRRKVPRCRNRMATSNRAVTGKYVGKDSAWLTARQTELQAAYSACLTAHQGYSRPGFSFNRVQFDSIAAELAEVEYAISMAAGTTYTRTYADLSA